RRHTRFSRDWSSDVCSSDLIMVMRAAADVVHLLALDVHTADEHRVRPLEILRRGRAQVLVDETDLPVLWEVCSNQQQALRRHEQIGRASGRERYMMGDGEDD